jgi:hypothetical protein
MTTLQTRHIAPSQARSNPPARRHESCRALRTRFQETKLFDETKALGGEAKAVEAPLKGQKA